MGSVLSGTEVSLIFNCLNGLTCTGLRKQNCGAGIKSKTGVKQKNFFLVSLKQCTMHNAHCTSMCIRCIFYIIDNWQFEPELKYFVSDRCEDRMKTRENYAGFV